MGVISVGASLGVAGATTIKPPTNAFSASSSAVSAVSASSAASSLSGNASSSSASFAASSLTAAGHGATASATGMHMAAASMSSGVHGALPNSSMPPRRSRGTDDYHPQGSNNYNHYQHGSGRKRGGRRKQHHATAGTATASNAPSPAPALPANAGTSFTSGSSATPASSAAVPAVPAPNAEILSDIINLRDQSVAQRDRSYDKFTCLQDALNVWHNEKLYYSSSDVIELEAITLSSNTAVPSFLDKLEELQRMTPPDVLEVVKNWTQEDVDSHILSGDQIEKARAKSKQHKSERVYIGEWDTIAQWKQDRGVHARIKPQEIRCSSDFFSSSDGTPFSSTDGNEGAAHQSEQEDLFRAARVRMKLQRNVFKSQNLYGAIPPNTSLDGEILWQPERIRAMWERKDVYGVLGLPREATTQQIKRQYRKLVLKLHPDKASDASFGGSTVSSSDAAAPSKDDRVAAFVAVTQAYKLLSGEITTINNSFWKSS
ncbi:hypothetical protein P43SY_001690 [Pythium insidiosum]|uniref:J domain-containing protein n=1 Tax=Pythium insidiosum TaxID=114742 RepID=A0AAD5Q8H1_PYTIN|nr:hypothetical protein P43SY_001690 [Pythium insidiosum]